VAEDLSAPAAPLAAAERSGRRPSILRGRFLVAYALLALALAGAVGGLVLMTADDREETGGLAWSSWQPTAEGEARAWQIADHVAESYRHRSGRVLVGVLAGPPGGRLGARGTQTQSQPAPIAVVAVRGRATDDSDTELAAISPDDSLAFVMCGFGRSCRLDEGLSSGERGVLLQRESLELALYAFRYVDGLEHVLVYLPPAQALTQQGAVQVDPLIYFRREQIEQLLERPLRATLPARDPRRIADAEANRVTRIVNPRTFTFQTERLPTAQAIIVLTPIAN
jgi:hypothetical protein